MKKQIKERIQQLKAEYESGQKMLEAWVGLSNNNSIVHRKSRSTDTKISGNARGVIAP